jgi:hypothetical protein
MKDADFEAADNSNFPGFVQQIWATMQFHSVQSAQFAEAGSHKWRSVKNGH